MAASLSTPGVVALLTAWQPQLQQLHQQAAARAGTNNTQATSPGLKPQQGAGPQPEGHSLSLTAFLEVLQDKGVIPQLLEPGDVQQVLRQLLVTQDDQVAAGVCHRGA